MAHVADSVAELLRTGGATASDLEAGDWCRVNNFQLGLGFGIFWVWDWPWPKFISFMLCYFFSI